MAVVQNEKEAVSTLDQLADKTDRTGSLLSKVADLIVELDTQIDILEGQDNENP